MDGASTRRRSPAARWLVVALVAGAVLVASVLPRPPGVVPPPRLGPFALVAPDWWLHAAAYAALSGALLFALDVPGRRRLAVVAPALVLAVAFGMAIEGVQALLPTRRFEVADLFANAVGATAAGVVWWASRRWPGVT